MSINIFYQYGGELKDKQLRNIIHYIGLITFSCDIFKGLLTMPYINGHLETNHLEILVYYGKNYLIFDLLALALGELEVKYLNYQEGTWLHQANLVEEDSIWLHYITSFNCSASSMVTVLIFVPQTYEERVYLTIIMIVNCGVFGYSLNELGSILNDINYNKKQLKINLTTINRYLQTKRVGQDLQLSIQNYLEYNHNQQKEMSLEKTNEVINNLPDKLSREIKKEVNLNILKNIRLFSDNFSQNFISNYLFDLVEELTFSTDEFIFKENDYQDLSYFYIMKGSVQVIQQVGKTDMPLTILKSLQQGDQFGQVEFMTETLKKCEIKGIKEDFEKFCILKDSLQNNDFHRLRVKCFTCAKSDHLSKNCPNTHLIFNKTKKFNLLKSHFQQRNQNFQRSQNSVNAYADLYYHENECDEILSQQELFIDNYVKKWLMIGKESDYEYSDSDTLKEFDQELNIELNFNVFGDIISETMKEWKIYYPQYNFKNVFRIINCNINKNIEKMNLRNTKKQQNGQNIKNKYSQKRLSMLRSKGKNKVSQAWGYNLNHSRQQKKDIQEKINNQVSQQFSSNIITLPRFSRDSNQRVSVIQNFNNHNNIDQDTIQVQKQDSIPYKQTTQGEGLKQI
ncbi:Cyclic nucleotide-binding protein [Pseudocohnilembus persalinus]|uniref:Cyclic nucleotide-binding protein n=1 Tax=Pseudocohnilembus persalinus TaxID=266149 RepID=A0A0V0QUA1_PSEPJ|nr:Cyclic nucleotide-binding protein [Pseudocohnilembus persalinus]|eukprot:KRX05842.1 Cyclic nucleotide-binding protein [Pseudocohnilembus persalinus]